jgi:hypothetical protein
VDAEPGWGGFQVGQEDGLAGPVRKRGAAGEAFVEDAAEGVAVGTGVDWAAGGLLGVAVEHGGASRMLRA